MINQAKAQSGDGGPDPAQFGGDGEEDDVGLMIGDYCAGPVSRPERKVAMRRRAEPMRRQHDRRR
jgi:hypothetical protein